MRRTRRLLQESIDWQEVSKFSRVSREWWNPNSKAGTGPLHALNPVRVEFIRNTTAQLLSTTQDSKPFHGLNMLDVGCGGGLLSESLCRLGGKVTSIDPSPENIGIAKWHATQDPDTAEINYQCTSIEDLHVTEQQFDIVCCLEVLEHVVDVDQFLSHLVETIKPGGLLFLSTLNQTIASYLFGILAAEKLTGIVPDGTHDWSKFIPPVELTTKLAKHQLKTVQVAGIVGDPYLIDFHLSPTDHSINYIMCAVKSTNN